MNESKHTPGPWRFEAGARFINADLPEGQAELAEVFPEAEYAGTLPVEANARLIAAAPALLKVARVAAENAAIVTDLLLTPSAATPEEMVNVITSLGKLARAAINKAEEG